MYNVQRKEADGWHDVEGTEFYELLRAKQKAQSILEKTNQPTRVVNERGAVIESFYPLRKQAKK